MHARIEQRNTWSHSLWKANKNRSWRFGKQTRRHPNRRQLRYSLFRLLYWITTLYCLFTSSVTSTYAKREEVKFVKVCKNHRVLKATFRKNSYCIQIQAKLPPNQQSFILTLPSPSKAVTFKWNKPRITFLILVYFLARVWHKYNQASILMYGPFNFSLF